MRTIGSVRHLLVLALLGCGEEEAPVATRPVAAAPASAAQEGQAVARGTPGAPPEGQPALAEPPLPSWELAESDFVEAEGQHRDPFRSYVEIFASERGTRIGRQVPVVLSQYGIDDLRVMAIVTGLGTPRAMLIDPTGVGTIVRRGDFLGRGEIVRGGADGSAEFEINWRVERIRREDVVLARDDPSNPSGAPVTRILPLHPGGTGDEAPPLETP